VIRGDRRHGARIDRGYTLIELLITMTILSAVLGAVYYSFFRAQSSATRTERVVDARQGSRAALQLIEREVRMVGSGWGRIPVYGGENGAPMTLHAVEPGYTTAAGNDSLELLGAWDVSTTLRSPLATSSSGSAIPCDSTAGFSPGDFVLVTNGSTAHIFQVTGVQNSPADLEHDATSIYNMAGGHTNWPVGGYPTGSRVYRVAWVTYKVDGTGFRTPCLTRRDQGSAPQVVATDVSAFHVWFLLQDATETRNPADLSLIDKIRPVIATQVADRGSAVITDSVWTMVRPRTF
jgi:prepilin-type N-terminal cleavage/methylation domain-containing protein